MGTTGLLSAGFAIALLGQPLPAIAACTVVGTTATCTGPLTAGPAPAGANYTAGVTNLSVQSLTGGIAATATANAISLLREGRRGDDGADEHNAPHRYPRGGKAGDDGPALVVAVTLDAQVANAASGSTIIAQSRGGRGGDGGRAKNEGSKGGNAGQGGAGGIVTLTVSGQVTGSGDVVSDDVPLAAILAQSLGGNGGTGGKGESASAGDGGDSGAGGSVSVRTSGTVSTQGVGHVGIAALSQGGIAGNGGRLNGPFGGSGGSGGGASPGGLATVYSQSTVTTSGESAVGILVQSLGGQGGNGGRSGTLFFGSGGDGVYGAAGGTAIATNAVGGSVTTTGAAAHGVVALSVGGGGGAGGSAAGIVALGSKGGTGGPGGTARVVNDGLVETSGAGAVGLMANSIGGGGGDGGRAAGIAAFGGAGSSTSSGGAVSVSNSGRVITRGESAEGIFAQSIGGGGGRGGSSTSPIFGIGGAGGGGGDGATVNVSSIGSVGTSGGGSTGIFAQSIGGGGGRGGNATTIGTAVTLAFGGQGGKGGAGGAVYLNAAAVSPALGAAPTSITTLGRDAAGVFAQSIGGGGGASGMALAVNAGLPLPFGSFTVTVAMGAKAGDGGSGGAVASRFQGVVSTAGEGSGGIILQSVGGGGGNSSMAVALGSGAAYSMSAGLGGQGGRGGSAGNVLFDGAAQIITLGAQSAGLMVQSIGGGGGNGGAAISASAGGQVSGAIALGGTGGDGGQGRAVTLRNAATIETSGIASHGMVAQSIGGGGGNGGLALSGAVGGGGSLSLALGGSGAAGGSAGAVSLVHGTVLPASPVPGTNYGILTRGEAAHGIVAQSIGGGGGTGGVAGSLAGAIGGALAIGLGGTGGDARDGSTVSVVIGGPVETFGRGSFGVLAQSIGGGGGDGGFSFGAALAGISSTAVSLGGRGGLGGDSAGTNPESTVVSVTGAGRVVTHGDAATAILAQSIGGGGGTGGVAVGAAMTFADEVGAAVTVALGGSGGAGGNAGNVVVDRYGTIATSGDRAHGIVAQSIGGGGGSGGFVGGVAAVFAGNGGVAANVVLGGTGGAGGQSGAVTLTQHGGRIDTAGDGAFGLLAQSIGGGGGTGGMALGAAATTAALSANVTMGGQGGEGAGFRSDGAAVTLTSTAIITTVGDLATGITAQSIGGGGGAGGVAAGLAVTGENGVAANVSLGGQGGLGGHAGTARAIIGGSVATLGDLAHGVLVQSVGGGGGAGGIAIGAAVAGENSLAAAATLGGRGSAGGNGGLASLVQSGIVTTRGDGSNALFVQSVGGGGGDGGMAIGLGGAGTGSTSLTATIGGSGAGGGRGGEVSAVSAGQVSTTGLLSAGLMAQSIGGGGGNGGMAFTGNFSLGNQASVTLGGGGGAGGDGGTVGVRRSAVASVPAPVFGVFQALSAYRLPAVGTLSLATTGAGSHGVVAQSIGGGGGNGGLAGSLLISGGDQPLSAQVAIGGAGAGGGNGGTVDLSVADRIRTGTTVPNAAPSSDEDVIVDLLRVTGLSAEGGAARGVVAQSIGGGGGDGGGAIAIGIQASEKSRQAVVSLGGASGGGGSGGTVTAAVAGSVATQGFSSDAILVQSVGGGGGTGGMSVSGSVTTGKGYSGSLAIGGTGGLGGDGGLARGSMQGSLTTTGDQARGLVVQSVGGGGGIGGMAVAGSLATSPTGGGYNGQMALGGSGGVGGSGGAVDARTLGVNSSIVTTGNDAYAVVGQSIGGGGGFIGGTAPAATPTRIATGNGAGGAVTLSNTGGITTSGVRAHGIVAQSIGGGGGMSGAGSALPGTASAGWSGTAGGAGAGGAVSVTNAGDILASGSQSVGIWAESAGRSAGAVTVTLAAGSDVRGGAGGTGVFMSGGTLRLDNAAGALITTVDGIAGRALLLRGTDNRIENRGTITGSVDAGPVATAFNNRVGGQFNMGPSVGLGGTGTLTSGGGVAVAGRGRIGTTALAGHFTQLAGATTYVDVAGIAGGGISADRLNASGRAQLAGGIQAELMAGTTIAPGTHRATILSATGGTTLTAGPLALTTPSTLNTSWSLQYPNANDVVLAVTLTTTAPSAALSGNQRSIASALGNAAASNPVGFSTYSSNVYGATSATSYATSMTSLGGDGGLGALLGSQNAAMQFMRGITARLDLLQRSADAGTPAPASFAPFALGSIMGDEGATLSGDPLLGMSSIADIMPSPLRFWAAPIGGSGRLDSSAAIGADASANIGGYQLGFDNLVAPNLLIGATGGYTSGSYGAGDLLARGQLEGGHVGGYAMWRSGPLYLTGALGYGRHEGKQARVIQLEGMSEYARSNAAVQNFNANLEMGARFTVEDAPWGSFALTPFAGVGLNAWRQDGGTETSRTMTGAGGVLGLTQQARSDQSVPISLGVRYDQTFTGPGGLAITPSLRAAWVHESRDSLTSTSSFALAQDQAFTIATPRAGRDRMQLNLGVQVAPDERFGFGLNVITDVGDRTQSLGGFGRFVVRW